jgi:hypothetical protein
MALPPWKQFEHGENNFHATKVILATTNVVTLALGSQPRSKVET